jgi:hypothetical protein
MSNRVVVFLFVIACVSCRSGKKELKTSQYEFSQIRDSTFLFDGKSLEGWEITNFGPQGPVYVSGGDIILGMGDGCTGITWKNSFPEINYKVTLEAKKLDGNDFFCGMTFPVDKNPCTLIVGGWGGTTVGLSCINGMDASENETTTLQKFEKDRWYRICLIVKTDTIKALIDDAAVVNFAIDDKKLSIRPEVELSKPFGIASWHTTAALRNIRVTPIKL